MAIAAQVSALLVEDNPDDAFLIQRLLLRSDLERRFGVSMTASLREALESIRDESPDVMLLDLNLPDSAGLSTLQQLRHEAPHVPVIVLTAVDDEETAIEAVRLGAQDYILKSDMAGNVLPRAITYAIQRKRAELELQRQRHALEDEVKRRTAELQAMNTRLEQEVAERRAVELALRAGGETTENHLAELQAILNSMAEGVIICDADGSFLTMNPAALAIHGFRSADEAAKRLRDSTRGLGRPSALDGRLLPPDEWPVSRVVRGETFSDYEIRMENGIGGRTYIGSYGGTPVRNGEGEIILAVLTVRDITEQKQLEERRSFLSAIVESSNDAIIGFNLNDEIVSWSRGAERMFGYSFEEIRGERARRILLSPGSASDPETLVFSDSVSRYEAIGVRQDGSRFDVALTLSPIRSDANALTGMSAVVRDITRGKRTEEALRLSEERFRTALKGTNVTIFNQDRDLRFTWVYNPVVLSAGELLGKRDEDIFTDPIELAALERLKRGVLETGEGTRGEVVLHVGERPWIFDLTVEPLRDPTGDVVGITCATTEITEHKRMAAAEREQRLLAEALRDTATALSSSLQLPDVLKLILENLQRVIPHDAADVMLLEGESVFTASSRGHPDEGDRLLTEQVFSVSDVPVLRAMAETGNPRIIEDVHAAHDWVYLPSDTQLRCYIGLPIWWQHNLIGFLNLFSRTPGFFSTAHIDRLQAFVAQAALAIQNARQYAQARQLAALEERQRLARDLHDAVNQSLFTASVLSEALLRYKGRNSEKVWEHLETLHRTTRGALAEMRTLLLELRPEQLMTASVKESFTQLVYAVRSRKRIDVSLEVDEGGEIDPEVKVAFYRIAQEALNNIVKHAQATNVLVRFVSDSGKIELHVEDDGKGFNVNTASAGLGLATMRERAAAIGAVWQVSSSEGSGTRISVIRVA